jgi:hypothetical protein
VKKVDNLILNYELDYVKILQNDDNISIVQLDLLHLGINRKKCDISKECINKSLPSFFNKPIIYRLNNAFFTEESTDVVEHARTEQQQKNIFIGGTIPESSPIEFIEKNGKTYLRMIGVIHKLYQPVLLNILKNRGGEVKISIELKVIDGEKNTNGILVIKQFKLASVCLLGEEFIEGIEKSNLVVTKFSLSDYNNFYLSFAKKTITNFPKQGDNKDISLENSKHKQFDYDFALKIKEQYSSIWHSGGEEFGNQAFVLWGKAKSGDDSKSIKNWIKRRESFGARHNKDVNLPGIVANMKWGTIVSNGEAYMKNIIKEAIDKLEKKEDKELKNTTLDFIAKEKLGTEQTIKINKSKEAMSDSAWGNEDKPQLKKDCLMAKNWKTLCKAVFLRCDKEYLEGTEGALGYPVMEKKGDEVIYNRNGLASARAYAVKNNESEILSDLKSIYKHLNLEWDNEKEGEKVDNSKIENTEEIQTNVEEVDEIKTNATKEVEEINTNTEEEIDKTEKSEKDKEVEENCKNCISLEEELKNVKEELVKYKRIEEEQKMSSLLESYSHCFSKEEKEDISSEINKNSYEELEKKIDNKIKEFVAKMKDIKPEDKKEDVKNEDKEEIKNTVTFSVSPFGVNKTYDFSKNLGEKSGLDEIINNSGVKIKK